MLTSIISSKTKYVPVWPFPHVPFLILNFAKPSEYFNYKHWLLGQRNIIIIHKHTYWKEPKCKLLNIIIRKPTL